MGQNSLITSYKMTSRLFLVLMAIIMVFLCSASSNPQGDFPPDHYEDIECFGDFETCVKNCSCPTGLGDEQLCRESCDMLTMKIVGLGTLNGKHFIHYRDRPEDLDRWMTWTSEHGACSGQWQ